MKIINKCRWWTDKQTMNWMSFLQFSMFACQGITAWKSNSPKIDSLLPVLIIKSGYVIWSANTDDIAKFSVSILMVCLCLYEWICRFSIQLNESTMIAHTNASNTNIEQRIFDQVWQNTNGWFDQKITSSFFLVWLNLAKKTDEGNFWLGWSGFTRKSCKSGLN